VHAHQAPSTKHRAPHQAPSTKHPAQSRLPSYRGAALSAVHGVPESIDRTMSGFLPRRSMACGAPRGTMLSEPGAIGAAARLGMSRVPSPATTYSISSTFAWTCSASVSRSWRSRVVAVAVHPSIDSFSGSRPMRFRSRKVGIETVLCSPAAGGCSPAAGGSGVPARPDVGGGGVGAGRGPGAGTGGVARTASARPGPRAPAGSGAGTKLSATAMTSGWPPRRVTSRSSVVNPVLSNRRWYAPSRIDGRRTTPSPSVVNSPLDVPSTCTRTPPST
jgi:hypothetical protein